MKETENYLRRMSEIRRTGSAVKETSFYGTLENLLNEIGKSMKPKVRCVINLQNRGAGLPDGGFFTPNQFQKSSNELIKGQMPERGAIEIKGTGDEVRKIAETKQVNDYLHKYRQVLVTNYRDFLLVRLDENNSKQILESFSIGENESGFWQIADHPQEFAENEQERLAEFLKRVMLSNAPLTKPEDVAWFLASYARDAKARIENADFSALERIQNALEDALGVTFEGEKGENFFRSTLVQTLFYGIFSAWVLWHKRNDFGFGISDLGFTETNPKSEIRNPKSFNWRTAVWELRVPMISVLFEQIATPSHLKNLDLVEVLNWTENVLNRVEREKFFANFAEDAAVQYFYEPFLEAFDPALRKQFGVWYTPPEIVKYMVERVDRVLREELGLFDGLADENVHILDPACGTGAYLVEVLRRINRTLIEKGEDATRGQKLKSAVLSRVYGFEILTAPFVVSHLQIGLLLEDFGVNLSEEKRERAGVFLTNSLTGWDENPKKKLPFPEFEEERDSAERVKKDAPILVVLGNPPYDGFAGVSPEEENNLVEPYKEGLIEKWGIKKFNLDDLYIRFFRLAERKISELSPRKGIVCYISNFSYLGDPSFVVMREKFLSEFDKIWIDCLNGDSRETGKTTPNGKPDPSIFSTDFNKAGIRVGTAVGLFVKKNEEESKKSEVRFRHFWGKNKREELLESIGIIKKVVDKNKNAVDKNKDIIDRNENIIDKDKNAVDKNENVGEADQFNSVGSIPTSDDEMRRVPENISFSDKQHEEVSSRQNPETLNEQTNNVQNATESDFNYEIADPEEFNRFSFRHSAISKQYKLWWKLTDLCEIYPFNGPIERRGFALISIDKIPLNERIKSYFDKEVSNKEIKEIYPTLMMTGNRIVGHEAREKVLNEFSFDATRIVSYPFKPFDIRWCYLENLRPLFSEPSPQLLEQRFEKNAFLISRDTADKSSEGTPFFFSNLVCDYDSISGHARHFPIFYKPETLQKSKKKNEKQEKLFGEAEDEIRANLSKKAREYLQKLDFTDVDAGEIATETGETLDVASLVWFHALAIGYSSEYLAENEDGIRQDFPRIPLPAKREDLIRSALLGKRVADLLDTEKQVAGITAGKISELLRTICVPAHIEGLQFQDDDFKITANWGYGGKNGITMPGKGKTSERDYSETELEAIRKTGEESNLNAAEMLELLGEKTFDVFLNNVAFWRNVPENAWNYYIGGYQVLKKWLSYREFALLGRALKLEEITEVTNTIRRISAILLLETKLNENYGKIKADFYKF